MTTINVKGVIVPNDDLWIYEYFEIEATAPKTIDDGISKADGGDLEVIINSPGGEIHSGSEIYTTLRSYNGKVVVKIVGIAASAASVIAMAGDRVLMSPTANFMIHNVSSGVSGDYNSMDHMSEVLQVTNKTLANSYMIKTGLDQATVLKLMNHETWFTPQQALANKFIDEIMFEDMNEKDRALALLDLLKLKTKQDN